MKNIDNANSNNKPNESKLPTFPDSLYPQLPQFLQDAVLHATSDQERDMLLLGTLTSISSCLPNVYGIYADDKVYSNLYLFVTAPPSSGKGKLKLCKKIIDPIHKSLKELNTKQNDEYKRLMVEWNENKDLTKPLKPTKKILFIPANNSSTGIYQLLSNNDGKGIIFETEGDTVSLALKTDYGNYSDGFRNAFHHETIAYYRRTGEESVEIDSPCLSVVLSGTPNQVTSLMPNSENGLFSRFIFYYLDLESEWIDVFKNSSSNKIDLHYNELGSQFLKFHNLLNNSDEIKIMLSDSQSISFKKFFSAQQSHYNNINSDYFIATIRRLGLISYRFMMIFTALRIMEDEDVFAERECSDIDFNNALKMVSILIKHSRKVFLTLPKDIIRPRLKNSKELFLDALPKKFDRQKYLSISDSFDFSRKTAERYITSFIDNNLIHRESSNNYINTLIEDSEETKDVEEIKDDTHTQVTSAEYSTSAESP